MTKRITYGLLAGLVAAAAFGPAFGAAPAAPAAATLAPVAAAAPASAEQAAAQTLTWTGNNSTTAYASQTTEATSGPATIVFENSTATGNTSGLQHTLTFDTSGGQYNDDVDVDILASPSDENGGRWEVEVDLSVGTYRFFCTIPGHGQMQGLLVVTSGGGGDPDEDTTPPEVAVSLAGDQDADGAYIGQATATVRATDEEGGSGLASVEYQVDDLGWQPYTEPVVVDEVGDHTIGYRATDEAGNVSEEGNEAFSVVAADGPDTTPPTVEGMVHGETNDDGAYLGRAEVMINAQDAQSEIASVEYTLDGGDWTAYTDVFDVTAVGDHTVTYRATDAAGNVSEVGELSFTVVEAPDDDTEPPVATASIAGTQDATWAYRGEVTVTLDATDEGSGVARTEYLLDDGDWTTYDEPVTVDEEGAHTMQYRAVDLGGNVSEVGTVGFTIVADTAAPACPTPDPSPVVVMGTIGTDVRNRVTGDGSCTIDDLIRDEARWSSHDAFMVHVRSVLAGLLEDGYVTGAERSRIVSAANRSDVGRQGA
ncbi:cupredoxin domain-containing protein [Nocardioides hwasunensis]|uniref:Copper-binding protein n=1 Tax=Nocardioides hwasunensis TaxID=397258 RepID=A0ABR8MH95_9ACTN|nr:copper-binding protein [Nocardioides hwasunensis]MBD3915446.1 copper-binding protein [Nocardioides hwasunensis]